MQRYETGRTYQASAGTIRTGGGGRTPFPMMKDGGHGSDYPFTLISKPSARMSRKVSMEVLRSYSFSCSDSSP